MLSQRETEFSDFLSERVSLFMFTMVMLTVFIQHMVVNAEHVMISLQFELIRTFMTPILGGNIIDASCGSGLFSRIFAKSGLFSSVVALDYSENMLKQCYEFIQQEENFPRE